MLADIVLLYLYTYTKTGMNVTTLYPRIVYNIFSSYLKSKFALFSFASLLFGRKSSNYFICKEQDTSHATMQT
jgi:hypothetical protein